MPASGADVEQLAASMCIDGNDTGISEAATSPGGSMVRNLPILKGYRSHGKTQVGASA
jgi:hypothetical protein